MKRLAQADGDGVLDVAPLRGGRSAAETAEDALKEAAQTAEVAEVGLLHAEARAAVMSERAETAARLPARLSTGLLKAERAVALHLLQLLGVLPALAPLVVGGALLVVAEHVVRRVDLLEAILGLGVAARHIGVVAPRQPPVGGLDLLLGGAAGDAEDFVEIGGHGGAPELSVILSDIL